MKLLLSWARDFVDITASPQQVADTMALRGFEVASIEHLGDDATSKPRSASVSATFCGDAVISTKSRAHERRSFIAIRI